MRIYEDLRLVQTRLTVLQNALVLVMVLLAGVFWHLQVVRGRSFKALAENNRSRVVPIAAPRGPLLDRRGRILVENRPSFNIVVRPEHVEDLDDLAPGSDREGRGPRVGHASWQVHQRLPLEVELGREPNFAGRPDTEPLPEVVERALDGQRGRGQHGHAHPLDQQLADDG